MSETEKKKYLKSRFWMCILYPESCQKNFKEILQKSFISWICSPLHDKDINELDNELKKPHFHLIWWYGERGPTTLNVAQQTAKEIGAVEFVQPIHSIANAVKYLIHLNNPEKYQYQKSDITCSPDVSLEEFFKLSKTDERILSLEITNFIKKNNITEFCDLVYYCADNDIYEWYDYCRQFSFFVNSLIKSQRHSQQAYLENQKRR